MKKLTKNSIILILILYPLLLFSKNDATNNENKFIVVLDAGHGGKDPGAVGKHSVEKDIALSITLKAGNFIEQNLPDVEVVYTRKTDVFPELQERARIANHNKAQLFVSIHVNYNPSSKPYGTETYVLGLHRADENFEVAKRENSVILLEDNYETKYQDFDPNKPESYIIFSVMQNTFLNQSVVAAALVQEQFKDRARRKDRGVKQLGLLVLAQSSMPGILIETGFISNPTEELYLMSDEGQDYIASAIYRAIREYKNHIELNSNFSGQNEGESFQNDTNENNEISKENINNNEEVNQDENLVDNNLNSSESISDDENDTVIHYRIQISSSYAKLDKNSSFFKGYDDVDIFEAEGVYKYVTANERSYEKIKTQLKKIQNKFPDAFIIAVKKGEIISLKQAFSETGLKNNNIN